MKYTISLALTTFMLLLLLLPGNARAVVDPFVKADWGASPVEVMEACGMPAFSSIDFEAKRTNYLAYRQTVSAHNFLAYYFFNDERLFQVRLVLRDELAPADLKTLADTLSGRLGEALTNARHQYRGSIHEGQPLTGDLFALSSIWRTPQTFSVVAADTDTGNAGFLFDVLILDATNPANHAIINRYLGAGEVAAGSGGTVAPAPQTQAQPQTPERARPVVTMHEQEPQVQGKLTFAEIIKRLSRITPKAIGGTERLLVYTYVIILFISFVVFALLLMARFAMRRRAEAEPGGKMQVKQALGYKTATQSGGRQLRMVSASRTTGKDAKGSGRLKKPSKHADEDVWPPLRSEGSPRIASLEDQNFQILNILLLMLIIVGAYVFGALHPAPPRHGVGILQVLPYLGRAFAVVGAVNFMCYLVSVKRERRFWPYLATGAGFVCLGVAIIWIFKGGYL